MLKVCSKCKTEKELEKFPRQNQSKDGRHSHCKACNMERTRLWKQANPERAARVHAAYREKNREAAKERARLWREQNRERDRANARAWARNNPERKTNYTRQYQRVKTDTDPYYKLTRLLRGRLQKAIRNKAKTGSAVRDLGMPIDAFLTYLNLDALDKYGIPYTGNESKFHIDHVRPLSSFDLEDPEQLRIAVRWDNLQVLTAVENLQKADKSPQMWADNTVTR